MYLFGLCYMMVKYWKLKSVESGLFFFNKIICYKDYNVFYFMKI